MRAILLCGFLISSINCLFAQAEFCISGSAGFARPGVDFFLERESDHLEGWEDRQVKLIGDEWILTNGFGFLHYQIHEGVLQQVGEMELPEITVGAAVVPPYAYFPTRRGHLSTVNFFEPQDPTLEGHITALSPPAFLLESRPVVAGGGFLALQSLYYSAPACVFTGAHDGTPLAIGCLPEGTGTVIGITELGIAYARHSDELYAVDLKATPLQAVLLSELSPSSESAMTLTGGFLVIAEDYFNHGRLVLSLYDVSRNPFSPRLVDQRNLYKDQARATRTPPSYPTVLFPDAKSSLRLLALSEWIDSAFLIQITQGQHFDIKRTAFESYMPIVSAEQGTFANLDFVYDGNYFGREGLTHFILEESTSSAIFHWRETLSLPDFRDPAHAQILEGGVLESFQWRDVPGDVYRYDITRQSEGLSLEDGTAYPLPAIMETLPPISQDYGYPFSVAVYGDYHYTLFGYFLIIQAPDGAEQAIDLRQFSPPSLTYPLFTPSMRLVGQRLFISVDSYAKLVVFGLEDPNNPALLSLVDGDGWLLDANETRAVGDFWKGGYQGPVEIFAISAEGIAERTAEIPLNFVNYHMVLSGEFLYALTWEGMDVYDLRDPYHPLRLDGLDLTSYSLVQGFWVGMLADQDRIYVFDSSTMIEIDLRDRTRPMVLDIYELRHGGVPVGIDPESHTAALLSQEGYELVDLCALHAPREIPFGWIDQPFQGASIPGNLIHVSGWAIDPDADGIEPIDFLLDGVIVPVVEFQSVERPDVAVARPGYPGALNSGFEAIIQVPPSFLRGTASTLHRLKVRVYDKDLNFREFISDFHIVEAGQ